MKFFFLIMGIFYCLLSSTVTSAVIKTETVEYNDGKIPLQGSMASDDKWIDQRPVVFNYSSMVGSYRKRKNEGSENSGARLFCFRCVDGCSSEVRNDKEKISN